MCSVGVNYEFNGWKDLQECVCVYMVTPCKANSKCIQRSIQPTSLFVGSIYPDIILNSFVGESESIAKFGMGWCYFSSSHANHGLLACHPKHLQF